MDLSRFGSARPWSLGVEEELMLVDAETLEPAHDGFSRVFGEATERIKPELFESFVEITTPILESAEAVAAELRALRREVAERASTHGYALLATGSHPAARGQVPIVPVERYERLKAELGQRLCRQRVCGLHVHVAVPDPDTCLRAFEGLVPRLPSLLAASANSPYWDGEESGWRSFRSQILLEMPTGGTPPVLGSWDDWEAASRDDSTRRHWDAWPRPEYGTLEVRVMDQPTSLNRTVELAAEVQRLVREAAETGGGPFDRGEYEAARRQAAREGGGPEAERQLELGPEAAAREIAALTLG
ncbi:MAG TPA: YbdK family carboxylate-amine ligase [Gaiellaceae bacterium]|nr:YbdK family carboxylate-amine ligase [Gaiellaceae bacterium]